MFRVIERLFWYKFYYIWNNSLVESCYNILFLLNKHKIHWKSKGQRDKQARLWANLFAVLLTKQKSQQSKESRSNKIYLICIKKIICYICLAPREFFWLRLNKTVTWCLFLALKIRKKNCCREDEYLDVCFWLACFFHLRSFLFPFRQNYPCQKLQRRLTNLGPGICQSWLR